LTRAGLVGPKYAEALVLRAERAFESACPFAMADRLDLLAPVGRRSAEGTASEVEPVLAARRWIRREAVHTDSSICSNAPIHALFRA